MLEPHMWKYLHPSAVTEYRFDLMSVNLIWNDSLMLECLKKKKNQSKKDQLEWASKHRNMCPLHLNTWSTGACFLKLLSSFSRTSSAPQLCKLVVWCYSKSFPHTATMLFISHFWVVLLVSQSDIKTLWSRSDLSRHFPVWGSQIIVSQTHHIITMWIQTLKKQRKCINYPLLREWTDEDPAVKMKVKEKKENVITKIPIFF